MEYVRAAALVMTTYPAAIMMQFFLRRMNGFYANDP
jgi:hypothetical protein